MLILQLIHPHLADGRLVILQHFGQRHASLAVLFQQIKAVVFGSVWETGCPAGACARDKVHVGGEEYCRRTAPTRAKGAGLRVIVQLYRGTADGAGKLNIIELLFNCYCFVLK